MAGDDIAALAIRLGRVAEAVCRHYLPFGRRVGRYWIVGDVRGSPGRSMFVRLSGPESGAGAAGHWTDAATAEFGDLLDVIREALGLSDFGAVMREAERFLGRPVLATVNGDDRRRERRDGSTTEAARRLLDLSRPTAGSLAETYLRRRGITVLNDTAALRFHPRCFYRGDSRATPEAWPAMLAAVTDLAGRRTGVHRTWLARDGQGKAPVETPRRAMGELLGHGVRFGVTGEVLAAGEGIETLLSVRSALPGLPALAALSAAHLGAILFPEGLRRLYIVVDRDPAGSTARGRLLTRATSAGIEAVALVPVRDDFNDDLRAFGVGALRTALREQLRPQDATRFLTPGG